MGCGAGARDFDRIVDDMVRDGFLDRADRPAAATESAWAGWEGWAPAAAYFHSVSRTMIPAHHDSEGHRGHQVMTTRSFPATLKRYPEGASIDLPVAPLKSGLGDVLRDRRTWRAFGARGVSLRHFATLLGSTFGVQRWLEAGNDQWVALKSSPSGGARHSIEAYVLVFDVEGLESGTYHYCPDRHALTSLARAASREFLHDLLPTQPGFHGASALVVLTSVFARMQWKYSHPHAYRVILLDAGHLGQTFALVATELGLAPFCTAALDIPMIEGHLGIDGVSEAAMLVLGVGTRPEGTDWAPRHEPSERLPRTAAPARSAWESD